MDKYALQERLKQFAIEIVRFADELPYKSGFKIVKDQIIRSGPSCAANYRAACRAKSTADFISKMGTVEEDLDETMFWLEFTTGLSEEWKSRITTLWKEGDELTAIIVASIVSAKRSANQ